jgi:hypothetical protein
MVIDVEEDGFQIDTLARFPKTMVAFDAYRITGYTINNTVIPYEGFEMQIGGGMDLATGVFTAPIAGIYEFSGTWVEDFVSFDAVVRIRKNGSIIGTAFSWSTDANSFGITVIVSLDKGTTVDTFSDNGGSINSNGNRWIHFTGHLIYPSMSNKHTWKI